MVRKLYVVMGICILALIGMSCKVPEENKMEIGENTDNTLSESTADVETGKCY